MIEREKELLAIHGLMGELSAGYGLSRKIKPRSSGPAFVASCSRRGKSGRAGAKSKTVGQEQGSGGGDNSVGSTTASGKGDAYFLQEFQTNSSEPFHGACLSVIRRVVFCACHSGRS